MRRLMQLLLDARSSDYVLPLMAGPWAWLLLDVNRKIDPSLVVSNLIGLGFVAGYLCVLLAMWSKRAHREGSRRVSSACAMLAVAAMGVTLGLFMLAVHKTPGSW